MYTTKKILQEQLEEGVSDPITPMEDFETVMENIEIAVNENNMKAIRKIIIDWNR